MEATLLFNESRRSKRYIALLPVTIDAVDSKGNLQAGSWPGRIIDLSRHGASLFLTRVMDGQYHIFFSVQENPDHILRITVKHSIQGNSFATSVGAMNTVRNDDGKEIVLKARPIWMNSYDHEDLVAFKMGVEFIKLPNRQEMTLLKRAMKDQLASIGKEDEE